MKRLFALILVLCLLLCACGKEETPETSAPAAEVPTTEAPATETPTTEAPTVETTEATESALPTHPLTGQTLSEPYVGWPTASTINNSSAALPHHGITQADWFFEIETEGGTTRGLAIFTDLENIETIGPVRSARTYLISLSASFNAPLAHCGGSYMASDHMHALNQVLEDYRDIDEFAYGSFFFRDKDRSARGYSYEHTLFTTGEKLKAAMEHKGYYDTVDENGVDYGYTFQENVDLGGDKASQIEITFRGGKDTNMTYNEITGLYEAAQYGSTWIDGNNNETLCFENVVVLYAQQTKLHNKYDHSVYELYGEGTGYLAINGQIVPIKWAREDVHQPFSFFLEDGSEAVLGVGHTYCAVIDMTGSVTFG